MRVEFEGSLSPAADLIAFGLAMGLTLALTVSLGSLVNEPRQGEVGLTWEDLVNIKSWKGFDPDGDGLLEVAGSAGSGLENLPHVPSLDGYVFVEVRSTDFEAHYLFENGLFAGSPVQFRIISPVHGISILIEEGEKVFPGELRGCSVEVEG